MVSQRQRREGYTKQHDIPTLLFAGGEDSLSSAPMMKMPMPMAEMNSESLRPRESTKMEVPTTCGGRVSEP
jgi:hypothetical protein